MAFSIRLTHEDKKLADSYAKLHSISLGEAFKKALFEKIEDSMKKSKMNMTFLLGILNVKNTKKRESINQYKNYGMN